MQWTVYWKPLFVGLLISSFSPSATVAEDWMPPLIETGACTECDSCTGLDESPTCGPVPVAGCDRLTGDWGGMRTELGENGIDVQAFLVQFYQGVTSGGRERRFEYAGHGDYLFNFDGAKLGTQEGFFVSMRAEHRFGETLGGATGGLYPTALVADLPVPDEEELYITQLLLTQALSENFLVYAGKINTLDGDPNAFASGRGVRQFSNSAMVFNPVSLRTVPYSTLGAGFAILDEGEPLFSFSALNAKDTVRTSGFDELFEEGVVLTAELRVPTEFFDLPGHQLIGGTWSSRDFIALGQDPRVILPNVPVNRNSDSWSLYWNFDQYLVMTDAERGLGWGLFGRAGIGDSDTNLLAYFFSFGVGGNSPLRGRETDTFGIGYYHTKLSNDIGPLLPAILGPLSDGQGVELFYNIHLTEAIQLTPDLQIIDPFQEGVDTAVVAGMRLLINF